MHCIECINYDARPPFWWSTPPPSITRLSSSTTTPIGRAVSMPPRYEPPLSPPRQSPRYPPLFPSSSLSMPDKRIPHLYSCHYFYHPDIAIFNCSTVEYHSLSLLFYTRVVSNSHVKNLTEEVDWCLRKWIGADHLQHLHRLVVLDRSVIDRFNTLVMSLTTTYVVSTT